MTPRQLIKKHEEDTLTKGVRIYGYIKPLANGEAQYEVYASTTSKRKGKPLLTKRIFALRTDKPNTYLIRDTIEYYSWSPMCHDHLIYDFHEKGGATSRNYERIIQGYKRGKWERCDIDGRTKLGYANRMLPLPMTMLNGFEGTRYQYCGYDPVETGLPFADYLYLYNITPKVELLVKAGLRRLLTEDICWFLTDNPRFGKWLAKHWQDVKNNYWSPYRTKQEYARTDPVALEEVRRAKREQKERVKEAKRRAELRKVKRYDKAIKALYKKVKHICAVYGAYEVIVPKTSAEMIVEGEAMHNCVGTCYASRQGTEDLCVFLHRDGKPCVDIRISLKTFKLLECRAVCNQDAPKDAWEIANRITEAVRMRLAA